MKADVLDEAAQFSLRLHKFDVLLCATLQNLYLFGGNYSFL